MHLALSYVPNGSNLNLKVAIIFQENREGMEKS
jgi:hypothetical protein